MEGAVRDAFLAAVRAFRGRIEMTKLAEFLAKGDVSGALAVLALDKNFAAALAGVGLEPGIRSFRDAVNDTIRAGALAAIDQLPQRASVEMAFDLFDPGAAKFVRDYDFNLIQQVTQSQVDVVRQTVERAVSQGGAPVEQARVIRESIGLTARQEAAVQSYRDALSSASTMNRALDRALRDGRFDRTVFSAARSGASLSPAQIDKMVDRYRERYVKYRAETIARTETVRAANQGQREAWRQARGKGLIGSDARRIWNAAAGDRTCEVCAELDEETAGFDEEFAPGIMEPPDPHPDCRCSVSLVFGKG